MEDKHAYRHKRYDVSILQSRTVDNLIESLKQAKENNIVSEVLEYFFDIHGKAKTTGVGRKANTVDKKIAKLKEMGYKIPKKGE